MILGSSGSSGAKNVVRGYTKKGKLFLDFDTNLTESIKSISISGSHLMVAGDHVYNHYIDCRDANYFLSEDSIYDVLALPGEKVTNVNITICNFHTADFLNMIGLKYRIF